MGWINEDMPEHEGYPVALEQRTGSGLDSDWVQVCYPDDTRRPIKVVQMGCSCGWRSARYRAPHGSDWSPFIVSFPFPIGPEFEDELAELWREHIRAEKARATSSLTRRIVR